MRSSASSRTSATPSTALAPLVAGAACGIAIIAVPLALTLELAAQSNRPAIDLDGALRGSLHPASLLTLVSANLFGTDGPLKDFWGPPSAAFGVADLFLARNMGDIYMGALPLLALVAAVAPACRRRSRDALLRRRGARARCSMRSAATRRSSR